MRAPAAARLVHFVPACGVGAWWLSLCSAGLSGRRRAPTPLPPPPHGTVDDLRQARHHLRDRPRGGGGDPVLYDEIVNSLDSDGEIRAASEARYRRGQAGTVAVKARRGVRPLRPQSRTRAEEQPHLGDLLRPAPAARGLVVSQGALEPASVGARDRDCGTVAPVASFLAFHVQQRFFAPAFPGLLIWTAAGLQDLFDGFPSGGPCRRRPPQGWPRGYFVVADGSSPGTASPPRIRS